MTLTSTMGTDIVILQAFLPYATRASGTGAGGFNTVLLCKAVYVKATMTLPSLQNTPDLSDGGTLDLHPNPLPANSSVCTMHPHKASKAISTTPARTPPRLIPVTELAFSRCQVQGSSYLAPGGPTHIPSPSRGTSAEPAHCGSVSLFGGIALP